MSQFDLFNPHQMKELPLPPVQAEMHLNQVLPLTPRPVRDLAFRSLCRRIAECRMHGLPRVAYIGPHVIKLGLQNYVNDLIDKGFITHIATNGAGLIHDFELTTVGFTSELVDSRLGVGMYGRTDTQHLLNDVVTAGITGNGLGETVGRWLDNGDDAGIGGKYTMDGIDESICFECRMSSIPMTVHVGIGTDVTAMHGNYSPTMWAALSFVDFLIFVKAIENVIHNGGVFMSFGSAVTAPEIFLKAVGMATQANKGKLRPQFTVAAFDIQPQWAKPSDRTTPQEPAHYNRIWKQLIRRTHTEFAANSLMFSMDHMVSIPGMWSELVKDLPDRE